MCVRVCVWLLQLFSFLFLSLFSSSSFIFVHIGCGSSVTLVVVFRILFMFVRICSFFFSFFLFFILLYVCFHAFLLQLPNLTKLPFSFLAYLSFCHEFSPFSIASYITSYRSIIIIPFTSSSLAFPFYFFVLLVTVQNCISLFNSTLDIVLLQSFVPSSPVLPESR